MSCRVEFVNNAVAEGWENCLSFKNENKLLDNNDFRNGKMKFQTRIFFNEDEQEYDLKLDFSEDCDEVEHIEYLFTWGCYRNDYLNIDRFHSLNMLGGRQYPKSSYEVVEAKIFLKVGLERKVLKEMLYTNCDFHLKQLDYSLNDINKHYHRLEKQQYFKLFREHTTLPNELIFKIFGYISMKENDKWGKGQIVENTINLGIHKPLGSIRYIFESFKYDLIGMEYEEANEYIYEKGELIFEYIEKYLNARKVLLKDSEEIIDHINYFSVPSHYDNLYDYTSNVLDMLKHYVKSIKNLYQYENYCFEFLDESNNSNYGSYIEMRKNKVLDILEGNE
tara:strand:- start:1430 stop:2434 length:1005 start_codon:yes stop_codon:yes gene_type:complete